MLAICIILLGTVAYSAYGQEVPAECYKIQRNECNDEPPSEDFPETVAELEDFCSAITKALACILKVREDCDPHGNMTKVIRETSQYIQSICDEDGSTYKVLSSNIGCIASFVEQVDHVCLDHQRNTDEGLQVFLADKIESHMGDIGSLSPRDMFCLHHFFTVTCGTVLSGVLCGDEVEDIITDMTIFMEEHMEFCSPEMAGVTELLRPVFRDALKSEEKFMSRIVPYTENNDIRRRRGIRIHLK